MDVPNNPLGYNQYLTAFAQGLSKHPTILFTWLMKCKRKSLLRKMYNIIFVDEFTTRSK